MSRFIGALIPSMQSRVAAWEAAMKKAEIDYIITCTGRTLEEQTALYAQGRTAPGPIVTWTMDSKHLTGEAFDFVIMFNGKPDWEMAHRNLWNKAIMLAASFGLGQVIGKNGKPKEYAHLQMIV